MKKEALAAEVRALMTGGCHGVLSSISVKEQGFPFGSLVRYCLGVDGQPVLLLSRIAEHSVNVARDDRVSLLVSAPEGRQVQETPRLALLGHLSPHRHELDAERYFRFFPETRVYAEELDFDFYRLAITRARFVGGFAAAHWLEAETFLQPHPFPEREAGMIVHMNEDHRDALCHYCDEADIDYVNATPVLVGIDGEGLHLGLDYPASDSPTGRPARRLERIPFPEPVSTPLEARERLVLMAKSEH